MFIKEIAKKTLIFSPLVLLLILTNYFLDPAHLFESNNNEQEIAKILLEGINVANVVNYDTRLIQKYYINGLKDKKEVIVLGSSRAEQISSLVFPNIKFFNNSVPGAILEDYMAIFEIYQEQNITPGMIILELNPWLLNKNARQNQTNPKSISSYYGRLAAALNLKGDSYNVNFQRYNDKFTRLKKYSQLFSLSYFRSCIRSLFNIIKLRNFNNHFFPTRVTESDVPVKLFDGSYSFPSKARSQYASQILGNAIAYVKRKSDTMWNEFYELDNEMATKLDRFVDHLLNKNIKVIFFLAPCHPYVYDHLDNSANDNIIFQAENHFRKIALKNDIVVIGSYNPKLCGLNGRDFYDAVHPKTEAVTRLFRENLGSLY